MINELILKNSPNSWLRNGFKKQCFIILFAILYTGSQTSFKGLFISLFSILKDSDFFINVANNKTIIFVKNGFRLIACRSFIFP